MISEPLGKPKPVRFGLRQWNAMIYIAQRNHDIPVAKVARIAADFLIRISELNAGSLPMLEQIRLQRAIVHRAGRDIKRTKR